MIKPGSTPLEGVWEGATGCAAAIPEDERAPSATLQKRELLLTRCPQQKHVIQLFYCSYTAEPGGGQKEEQPDLTSYPERTDHSVTVSTLFPHRGRSPSRQDGREHRERRLVVLDLLVAVQPGLQPGGPQPQEDLQQPRAQVRGPELPGAGAGVPGVQRHPLSR